MTFFEIPLDLLINLPTMLSSLSPLLSEPFHSYFFLGKAKDGLPYANKLPSGNDTKLLDGILTASVGVWEATANEKVQSRL